MAIGNKHKKFGEDRTCSSGDMIVDKQTHTHTPQQTDRHAHRNTLCSLSGRSNKLRTCTAVQEHLLCSHIPQVPGGIHSSQQ